MESLKLQQRTETILATAPEEVTGFYYPDPEQAKNETLRILKSAQADVFYFDLDDTIFVSEPILRNAVNRILQEQLGKQFKRATNQEVLNAGGRLYQLERLQEAARQTGTTFSDLFNKLVATNPKLHAGMFPHKGTLDLQKQIEKQGGIIGGYPTARPHSLSLVTASALKQYGFSKAPIVDVAADHRSPNVAKVAFFRDTIVPNIPTNVQTFLIDDHVQTAIDILKQCGEKVIPLVPVMSRSTHQVPILKEYGIVHGIVSDLQKYIQERK